MKSQARGILSPLVVPGFLEQGFCSIYAASEQDKQKVTQMLKEK